jgi:hypothetical protein
MIIKIKIKKKKILKLLMKKLNFRLSLLLKNRLILEKLKEMTL